MKAVLRASTPKDGAMDWLPSLSPPRLLHP